MTKEDFIDTFEGWGDDLQSKGKIDIWFREKNFKDDTKKIVEEFTKGKQHEQRVQSAALGKMQNPNRGRPYVLPRGLVGDSDAQNAHSKKAKSKNEAYSKKVEVVVAGSNSADGLRKPFDDLDDRYEKGTVKDLKSAISNRYFDLLNEDINRAKSSDELVSIRDRLDDELAGEKSSSLKDIISNDFRAFEVREEIKVSGLSAREIKFRPELVEQLEAQALDLINEAGSLDELRNLDLEFLPSKSSRQRLKAIRDERLEELEGVL